MLSDAVFKDMIDHFKTRYRGESMDEKTVEIWWDKLRHLSDADFANTITNLCGSRTWPFGWGDVITYIQNNYTGREEFKKLNKYRDIDNSTTEQMFHQRLYRAMNKAKKTGKEDCLHRYFRCLVKYYRDGVFRYAKQVDQEGFTDWCNKYAKAVIEQQNRLKTTLRNTISESTSNAGQDGFKGALF